MTALITATLTLLIITAAAHAKQPRLTVRLSNTIVQVWTCETQRGLPRSPAPSPWKPHSDGWRRARLNTWTLKRKSCLAALHRSIPNTEDWVTAVYIVQRVYPGTKDWLLRISRREGGWGPFVMNHQGSGAGGWMQFMSSTFYAYNDRAYQDVRRRGWRIDPRTSSWTHPLGQAVTAGYMRYVGLDGCHWCL